MPAVQPSHGAMQKLHACKHRSLTGMLHKPIAKTTLQACRATQSGRRDSRLRIVCPRFQTSPKTRQGSWHWQSPWLDTLCRFKDLKRYIENAVEVDPDRPVLVDKYLDRADELDVDALCDKDGNVVIAGIMQHIEQAGVHSGERLVMR